MYHNLNLSGEPVRKEQLIQILSDNNYRKINTKLTTEVWQHEETLKVINVPISELFIPTDFVLHLLKKANIPGEQIAFYEPLIYRNLVQEEE